MKFTDGYWLSREGYTSLCPAQAYDAREKDGALEVYAPVRLVRERGDTLNGPQLTFEVSSPASDVARVRMSHFRGGLRIGPEFSLASEPGTHAQVRIDDHEASLTTGNLQVKFHRGGPWLVEFVAQGRVLTQSGSKAAAYVKGPEGKLWFKDELGLDVGELVWGLGERFSAFVKNGQTVDIWNKDGGTASEQTYKNIPFYLTNRGYGVFINHPGLVSFEVASEKVSRVQFCVEGEELEYFVIYGPTPKEILTKYTALTGRAPLPPAWSFGLWLTTSFTTNYDEATVTSFIDGMAERQLPLSVFHFDCFWMREFHWTDFLWDSRTFPDPRGMLARLKAKGVRICLWINPYLAQRSVLFEQGQAKGYLLKKPDGGVWQTDLWQAGMGIVDFTNPEARAWYAAQLDGLVELGVDAFKTDFGERIPTDVVWYDKSDPARMHNYYSYLYNQTVFQVLQQRHGAGEAVVFGRAATVGGQKFPVHWGGDCESSFPSMAESLRGGLSLGLSGFGFWSHDIGGFEGLPPEDLFHRWLAFGLLSSHSRLHGSSSYRVPWAYGETAVEVARKFTLLKLALMPYLYAQAVKTTRTGVPLMRAALLEYPEDLTCQTLDRQYFLGSQLLVAPVFRADGQVDVYLPEGRWTHLLSGEILVGPGWRRETHGPMSLPLYVKPNSVLAMAPGVTKPDSDWSSSLELHVFALDEGHSSVCELVEYHGRLLGAVKVTRNFSQYTVVSPTAVLPFTLVLGGKTYRIDKREQTV